MGDKNKNGPLLFSAALGIVTIRETNLRKKKKTCVKQGWIGFSYLGAGPDSEIFLHFLGIYSKVFC